MTQKPWMNWLGWGITVLVTLPFGPSAAMKIMKSPQAVEGMAKMGFPDGALGILAVLGAILLTGYLGGAICTHLRVSEPVYIPAIMGILIWFGLWLRESRLRALLPLR